MTLSYHWEKYVQLTSTSLSEWITSSYETGKGHEVLRIIHRDICYTKVLYIDDIPIFGRRTEFVGVPAKEKLGSRLDFPQIHSRYWIKGNTYLWFLWKAVDLNTELKKF
jgi:hypothetical protein